MMLPDYQDRQAVIDLAALSHNFRLARRMAGDGVKVMGVVKADAYGHGLVPVAHRLVAEGAECLGVARLSAVEKLRRAGVGVPVAVLTGLLANEAETAVRLGAIPFIYDVETAEALSAAGSALGRQAQVVVKINTGMTRLGFDTDDLAAALERLESLRGLRIRGLASHFASADEADKTFANLQLKRFNEALALVRDRGLELDMSTMSNSAALIDLPGARFDLVRPGIMLYGCRPSEEMHNRPDLRPVMTVRSRVAQLRDVPVGVGMSYGLTYTSPGPRRIATIPLGYGHGLSRALSNRGEMLINGRRAPIVGRVCMNLTLLDVTGVPEAAVGDEVAALGGQGDEMLGPEEVGGAAGTIGYEPLCTLGSLNPRAYVG